MSTSKKPSNYFPKTQQNYSSFFSFLLAEPQDEGKRCCSQDYPLRWPERSKLGFVLGQQVDEGVVGQGTEGVLS